MAVDQRKLISVMRDAVAGVAERYDGYRTDLFYTTTQGGDGDTSEESAPFVRYVDLWAAAVAVGAEEQVYVSTTEQHRFIQGSVLQGDLVRIEFL